MSDYLGYLVEKSLNLTEVVQPRLSLLFEPQQSAAWLIPGVDINMDRVDGEQTSAQGEVITFPTMKSFINHLAESKASEANQGVSRIDVDRQSSTSSPSKNEHFSKSADKKKSQSISPSMNEHLSQSPDKKKSPSITPLRRAGKQSGQEQKPQRLTPASDEVTAKPPASTVLVREQQTVLKPYVKNIESKERVSSEKQPFVPLKMPAPMAREEAPQVTPTINVTIGRIEVRATPPPVSKSGKQRSAPPAMSLEEYLGKRSQGGRG